MIRKGILRMAACEVCGNAYDKSFEVRRAGESHILNACLGLWIHEDKLVSVQTLLQGKRSFKNLILVAS